MDNFEKFNKIVKDLKPIDIKQEIKNPSFSLVNYKSPVVNIEINKIEKSVNIEDVEKIVDSKLNEMKNNFLNEVYKEKPNIFRVDMSERQIKSYVVASLTGTAVMTPIYEDDFLERGGVMLPVFTKIKTPDFVWKENRVNLVSLEVKKNDKDGIRFKANYAKQLPRQNWFSMSNPIIYIVASLVIAYAIYKIFK
jgi:hypothetical protein